MLRNEEAGIELRYTFGGSMASHCAMVIEDAMAELAMKRPATIEEMAAAIGACAAGGGAGVRITGSGAMPMTPMTPQDNSRPVQEISTLRMNKVLEHAVNDMTVIVQAGIGLETLQRQLAWHNQWLPVDPPGYRGRAPGSRTVGGLIASNSLGPLRLGFGDWRLLVMGMRWVDGMGTIIKGGGRTVKNVAGYSTPRMMIGSCGSLGAIGEVTLRTFARPADEQCVIFFCGDAARAEQLVAEILLSGTTPAYIEAVGGATFSANPLQLPTMKGGVAVVAGFMDRAASCAAQIEVVRNLAPARGLESMAQTAAQAGRLRLWLTSEPEVGQGVGEGVAEGAGGGAGYRLHVLSSEVCAVIAAIESAAATGGGQAWAVGEAASGVVRTVIHRADATAIVRKIAGNFAESSYFPTQFCGSSDTTRNSPLVHRIKEQLDPANVFGVAAI